MGVGGVGGSEGKSDAPEKVSRPSAGSYMATKVRAVWGGTSSDQRCGRWFPEGTAVLVERLWLGSKTCDDEPVLMVSPGGVCQPVDEQVGTKNGIGKTHRCGFRSVARVSMCTAWQHDFMWRPRVLLGSLQRRGKA